MTASWTVSVVGNIRGSSSITVRTARTVAFLVVEMFRSQPRSMESLGVHLSNSRWEYLSHSNRYRTIPQGWVSLLSAQQPRDFAVLTQYMDISSPIGAGRSLTATQTGTLSGRVVDFLAFQVLAFRLIDKERMKNVTRALGKPFQK